MYLLDANVFIQAKNTYYAFDVCPGFWDSMIGAHEAGSMASIRPVKIELEVGKDDLSDWVHDKVPASFFRSVDEGFVVSKYREVIHSVQTSSQYYDLGKADFSAGADGWLVAYAAVYDMQLVTQEQLRPEIKNRVPITNVAEAFGVKFVNTLEMLRALKIQYTWQGK